MIGRAARYRVPDGARVRSEIERNLAPDRVDQLKKAGRMMRSARRRAERRRFRSDADYFDFLVARAVRRGSRQPVDR